MLVSVIIINYNTNELTSNCISSILQYTTPDAVEIIVVDNASPKDDPAILAEKFPGIRLIRSPENGGFAKGNNLGITHAKGEVILLLNSDAYLTEPCIEAAATELLQRPEIAALSVRINYEDGRFQHNARRFRSIRNELLDILRPVLWLMPYRKRARLMLNQHFYGDFDTTCDWVGGAFMMFRKEMLNHFPGRKLDERYFMYGEDQLWCWQWKRLGYSSYFLSQLQAVHIGNASTGSGKALHLMRIMTRQELDLIRLRKGTGWYYHVFRVILYTKEYMRLLLKMIYQKISGKRIH